MKSDPNNPNSISAKARARRLKQFVRHTIDCHISNASILDIGGTLDYWHMNLQYVPNGLLSSIDIVNLDPQTEGKQTIDAITLHMYTGDALDQSSLRQDKYDIVHSNSVIEHVGNLRAQQKMASIIKEIGHYYWVQTPVKSFPVEPHFYFPFFAYLPLWSRTWLHQNFKLGFMEIEPDWLEARMVCEETRLLTKQELKAIFDDCNILTERFMGICKSYTATNFDIN